MPYYLFVLIYLWCVALCAQNTNPLITHGKTCELHGEYDAALSAFYDAYSQDSLNSDAIIALANCLHNLGAWDKAMEITNKALAINPNDAYAYQLKASLHTDMGNHHQALQALNQTIAINPNYTAYYLQRASVNYLLNKKIEAMNDLSIAWQIDNEETNAYLTMLKAQGLIFTASEICDFIHDDSFPLKSEESLKSLFCES